MMEAFPWDRPISLREKYTDKKEVSYVPGNTGENYQDK